MQAVLPLRASLNSHGKFRYKAPDSVADFLIVGGGVVGLAIAQRLSNRFPRLSTILVERHVRVGEEISSRNSEVIHSGLYYPPESLKTRLCLRGRDLLYDRCKAHNIPFQQTGKLVVAASEQLPYIYNLHAKSLKLSWPPHSSTTGNSVLQTNLLTGDEARQMEPDLSPNIAGALWCPQTGIVDSHTLMQSMEADLLNSEGGDIAYATRVVRLDPYENSAAFLGLPPLGSGKKESGWVVQTCTAGTEESGDALLARTVINTAGLSATLVLNSILPPENRIPMYYARGSYASYHGPGTSQVSHLIYPCPHTGPNAHAFQSLGTHLTLDLNGKIRFGPDIEWLSAPSGSEGTQEDSSDFWTDHLVPDESRLKEMHRAVTEYLPGVQLEGLQPDYVGMRPKLVPPSGGFQDFVFHSDYADSLNKSGPIISLLGIESPGLTSSLAIAEMVVEELIAPYQRRNVVA
ncbi:FAD dependent oxidoreductase [Pluteus cervinus]|uniref:FAD dependent oxidoreductase n=1 Tax=Pluteus cervinus TaxID=181527 RepID=A0ACD3B5W7_9AGAR|nr:FAD dependent oxidoreductase [Pluteus cervinus]